MLPQVLEQFEKINKIFEKNDVSFDKPVDLRATSVSFLNDFI
jgi:hypothetical protein